MRKFTGVLTLSTVSLALSATAYAGSPGAYTLSPITPVESTTYVQPTTSTYVQPYTAGTQQTETTTYTQPTMVETPSTEPQIGEIIYNVEPLQPSTTTYTTESYTTESYTAGTASDSGTMTYSDTPTYQTIEIQSDSGSYVSSPIIDTNTSNAN